MCEPLPRNAAEKLAARPPRATIEQDPLRGCQSAFPASGLGDRAVDVPLILHHIPKYLPAANQLILRLAWGLLQGQSVRDRTKRMVRVGVSGVAATGIDIAALVLLVEALGSHVTLAAFLAAALGGVSNFLINKYWAFRDRSPLELRQVTVYSFVSLVTAAFVAVAVHLLAVVMVLPYLLAKAIAAVLVFVVWTYPAQARLVFPSACARKPLADSLSDSLADSLTGEPISLDESLALE